MSDACVWSGSSAFSYEDKPDCSLVSNLTNSNGKWGKIHDNDTEYGYIFVLAPAGYKSTSPPIVKGESAEFGFVSDDVTLSYEYDPETYAAIFNEQDKKHQQQIRMVYVVGCLILLILLIIPAWKISVWLTT